MTHTIVRTKETAFDTIERKMQVLDFDELSKDRQHRTLEDFRDATGISGDSAVRLSKEAAYKIAKQYWYNPKDGGRTIVCHKTEEEQDEA